jgi:formylglycine-generating enzyme required for sulfatase activity
LRTESFRDVQTVTAVAALVALTALALVPPRSLYVRVPRGEFWMGCVPADARCGPEEKPRHRVRISRDYWMRRTEVTIEEYRRFVRATRYRTWAERQSYGRVWSNVEDSLRAESGRALAGLIRGADSAQRRWRWIKGLSWSHPLDPRAEVAGKWPAVQVVPADAEAYCKWESARLPTEAEWERAARGGRDGWIHVWGNEPEPRAAGANYANGPDMRTKQILPEGNVFALR